MRACRHTRSARRLRSRPSVEPFAGRPLAGRSASSAPPRWPAGQGTSPPPSTRSMPNPAPLNTTRPSCEMPSHIGLGRIGRNPQQTASQQTASQAGDQRRGSPPPPPPQPLRPATNWHRTCPEARRWRGVLPAGALCTPARGTQRRAGHLREEPWAVALGRGAERCAFGVVAALSVRLCSSSST